MLIVHLDDENLSVQTNHERLIMAPDYHPLVVDRVIPETPDASTLALQIPASLQPLFQFEPGQFLTLRIPREDRFSPRCYSISSGSPTCISVTVKRVRGGFGSNWLLDHLKPGDTIGVRPPSGRFTLRPSVAPLVFFAAGSGITPMMSMLHHAAATGSTRLMAMFYANQSAEQAIFGETLRVLSEGSTPAFQLCEWLDDVSGYATAEDIRGFATRWSAAQFMVCGPEPFMHLVIHTLEEMGVQPDQIQTEKFQSLADEPLEPSIAMRGAADQTAGFAALLEVSVSGETHTVPVHTGETLLAAMEREGLAIPYSCREGSCGSCMGKLLEGTVEMDVTDALSPRELERGYVLTCQARPTAAVLRLDIDA